MMLIQLDTGRYEYASARGLRAALLGVGFYLLYKPYLKQWIFGLVCQWNDWNKEWVSKPC